MHTDNSNIQEIFKGLIFTENEIKIIESVFHKVKVKKGTILLTEGDVVDYQYYILDGCLRSYHIDADGKEYTVQFGIEDWWMSDFTAFFSSERAIMTIEAIQNSTAYKISKQNKEYLYAEIPKIESFFRKKLESAFAAFQRRILAGLSQSAKERYLHFIKTYPDIEKCVKMVVQLTRVEHPFIKFL